MWFLIQSVVAVVDGCVGGDCVQNVELCSDGISDFWEDEECRDDDFSEDFCEGGKCVKVGSIQQTVSTVGSQYGRRGNNYWFVCLTCPPC